MHNDLLDWGRVFKVEIPVIAIVGLAKNTGKTVTINYLQKVLERRGRTLGLTSIGRDGERYDALTQLPKPSISVRSGTLLATANHLLTGGESWSLLERTGVMTPLGEVELVKVVKETSVVLAGPSKNKDLIRVLNQLKGWGADCILIDGAFDRQSSAAPALSRFVVLASGAALSCDLEQVVMMTRARVEQLTLPVEEDPLGIGKEWAESTTKALLRKESALEDLKLTTSLLTREEWLEKLAGGGTALYLKGAIGEQLGEALRVQENPPRVVIEDGSKIFMNPELWKQLKAKKVEFRVGRAIDLLGVSVNPTLPGGTGFEPTELLEEMGQALAPIPVFDAVQEKKYTK